MLLPFPLRGIQSANSGDHPTRSLDDRRFHRTDTAAESNGLAFVIGSYFRRILLPCLVKRGNAEAGDRLAEWSRAHWLLRVGILLHWSRRIGGWGLSGLLTGYTAIV